MHKASPLGIPLGPVNSQCGGLSAVASKYIYYYLQKLIPYITRYVKNSTNVLNLLREIDTTSPNIRCTTSDAKSMYSNIDPTEGVRKIKKYIKKFGSEYKGFFPTELILKLLWLVMIKKIFKFGNTW